MTNKSALVSGLCLAAAMSICSASAQTGGIRGVNLPRAFTVSGVKLPAGEYSIRELSGTDANTALLLRSASGASTIVLAEPITKAQQTTAGSSSLTLRQAGGQLQLDEVWFAGSEVGYHILSLGKRP